MKTNADQTVLIDAGYHWRPITKDTPRGVKMQLINKAAGVALYGTLGPGDPWFTHWAPAPTFLHEPDPEDI